MSLWFKRFLGLILIVTTVGIATCQSFVKAANMHERTIFWPGVSGDRG